MAPVTSGNQRTNRLALLLIAAFAANWIVGPAVFSLHEHVWCVEHHQLRHVHEHTQHARDHHHDIPSAPEQRASLKVDDPCCSPDHEGCPFLAQLLQQKDSDGSRTLSEPHGDGNTGWSEAAQPQGALLRLRFAPKQSPPLV